MDSSKFKELLLLLTPTLYRVAYRIVKDEDIAKDMVQDAYILLWDKRDMLDELDNIGSYAIKVLRNRCIDYLRTTHLCVALENVGVEVGDNKAFTQRSDDKERLGEVMKRINLLPERQKQVLKMRCIRDLTIEEISTLTGLSNLNVRTLLSRARKKLRELCES